MAHVVCHRLDEYHHSSFMRKSVEKEETQICHQTIIFQQHMILPLFTIAIPAYKKAFLHEAIDGCIKQTYNNLEIVIVDDASPENLASVSTQFTDPRIRYYRNEKNCGAVNVVDNWNICLSYATGEYIICMGDDDKLLPNCLEEYVKLMEKYPGLGVYHAWTEIIDEQSNFLTLQQPRPEFESALSLAWNRWNGRNRQYIGDFCYNVEFLRQEGGFYKTPMAWGSDDISAVRAAAYKGIANTQAICFQYRMNSLTITQTGNNEIKIKAILQEKKWFEDFISTQEQNTLLNETDRKYLECLRKEFQKHFGGKIRYELLLDMRAKPTMLFHWLRKAPRLGISHKSVYISMIKAILGQK